MGVKGRKAFKNANTGTNAVARGFFSGVIAGALVSALGLGAVSVVIGLPGDPPPEATALDVPAGSEFNQSRADDEASLPRVEGSPDPAEAPQVPAPEPDDLASISGADTRPAAQPETGEAESGLTEPAADAGAAGVEVDSDSPVLPSPQSMAPEAPEDENTLSISTDPAQPAMPAVEEDSAAFPQDQPTGEATTGAPEAPPDDPVTEAEPQTTTELGAPSDMDPEAPVPEAFDPEQPDPEAEPQAGMPDGQDAPEDKDAAQNDAAKPAQDDTAASGTIGDLATQVQTNRLPSVGDPVEAPEARAEAASADPEAAAVENTRPPLERFAAEFDTPGDRPLMSIVLIDDGSSPVGLQALESFPYPLSFAVDAGWAGATEAMARYRAAGFEVLLMADLPEGASAQDAEVAMQAYFSAVPEAVAVMEGTGSGLQSSREAAEQLAPILLDSGHGLVLFPKGLNTARKLLAREGVPAASVFRDFDANGQTATVIRRFLDQAAFKARQEEAGVIMLGRLRPDTISALLLWGLQDRASSVVLAPVSALLRAQ